MCVINYKLYGKPEESLEPGWLSKLLRQKGTHSRQGGAKSFGFGHSTAAAWMRDRRSTMSFGSTAKVLAECKLVAPFNCIFRFGS